MVVLDLLGRRTTLRILWELRGEALTFRALQEACGTNARLLNTRLAELRASGLVERGDGGYQMTAEGRQLSAALQPPSNHNLVAMRRQRRLRQRPAVGQHTRDVLGIERPAEKVALRFHTTERQQKLLLRERLDAFRDDG